MRSSYMNKNIIAASLLVVFGTTVVLNPLNLFAASQGRQPDLQISLTLPDRGMLDRYHDATRLNDSVAASLYALRNIAVLDLLETRKALKILLGGTTHARKLKSDSNLSFDVPPQVRELYGVTEIPEVTQSIDWLSKQEPQYDASLRSRLVLGLAYLSAQLTKFDQELKFFQKDYWMDPAIDREFYSTELSDLDIAMVAGGSPFAASPVYSMAKHRWLKHHGMDDVLTTLAGHREHLLNRYHILAIEIDKKPLYQHIYAALTSHGFPSPNMVQSVAIPYLPSGNDPIPMPTEFEEKLNRSFERMMGIDGAITLSKLSEKISPQIDKALFLSFDANTNRLKNLTETIDYSNSLISPLTSPLLELAQYEPLWTRAEQKYAYLKQYIDFDSAHKYLKKKHEFMESIKRSTRYTAYGLGATLGLIGMIATGGAEGILLGVAAKTWLVSATAVTSAQSLHDYIDSRRAAQAASELFLGTTSVSSNHQMREAVLINKEDFRMMMASLILIGCELPILSTLSKGRSLVQAGGRSMVSLTREEVSQLRAVLKRIKPRVEALAPQGRQLLTFINEVINASLGTPSTSVVSMKSAISAVAAQLKTTPALVREKLLTNPVFAGLIRGYEDRLMANPGFLMSMMREQLANGAVTMTIEYTSRGDKFNDELKFVTVDMVSGAFITGALVWITAPKASTMGARQIQTVFDPGFSVKERLKYSAETVKTNFIVGFIVNAGTLGLIEAIENQRGAADRSASHIAKDSAADGLISGLSMALWSNPRFQATTFIQSNIDKVVPKKNIARIILGGMSLANNSLGAWTYVKWQKFSYDQLESWTGFKRTNGLPTETAPSEETSTEDPNGFYLKAQGTNDPVEFMFDFLSRPNAEF